MKENLKRDKIRNKNLIELIIVYKIFNLMKIKKIKRSNKKGIPINLINNRVHWILESKTYNKKDKKTPGIDLNPIEWILWNLIDAEVHLHLIQLLLVNETAHKEILKLTK